MVCFKVLNAQMCVCGGGECVDDFQSALFVFLIGLFPGVSVCCSEVMMARDRRFCLSQ